MKPSALWREIWRDVASGTAWTILFTLLATLLLTGLTVVDLHMVTRLNQQAEEYRSVMANVQVLEAPGKVDPAACMALSYLPGVQAAGAIRTPQHQISANALPSSTIRTYEATPGVEKILRVLPTHSPPGTNPSNVGVFLSQSVAETLGIPPNHTVRLDNEDTHILGVFPWPEEDGRRPGFAYSIFTPTPPIGNFDECWVDIWPLNPNLDTFIRSAAIPSDELGQPVKVYAFNSTLGSTFNGPALLHGRITALTPYLIVGIASILGAASVWRRRLEFSSDLHAGVSRRDLVAKYMWETGFWTVATLVLALPIISVIILRNPIQDQGAMWQLAFIHLSGATSTLLLSALLATLTIHEKHLLVYFKHR